MRRSDWLTALLLALVYIVLYAGIVDAGYVQDYIGWLERVNDGGFAGAWHAYDYAAHLELYALMMWSTVWLRGVSEWLVFGLIGVAFVTAGVLLARLVATVLRREGIVQPAVYGTLAALLWAVSPTNTEVLVWRVCLHYIVSAIIWFGAGLSTLAYVRDGARKHLVRVGALAVAGVFSLELGYALPLALAGLGVWAHWRYGDGGWLRAVRAPLLALLAVVFHLLVTRVTSGAWIGHYGSDAVTSIPVTEVLAAPWRWAARTGLHYRLWPYEYVVKVTAWLAKPWILAAFYGSAALAAGLAIWSQKTRKSHPWPVLVLWLWLVGCATAPIAPLFFYDLLWVSGDRLGFLPGAFVAAGLISACSLLPRKLGLVAAASLVTVSLLLVPKPIAAWRLSADLEAKLVRSYKTEVGSGAGPVYLLGYATSAKGTPVFADFRPEYAAISSHLEILEGRTLLEQPYELAQFNAGSSADTVYAEWGGEKLYVSLKAAGGWWWRKGFGLTDFEDERGKFRLSLKEYHYEVEWETPPAADAIFLYQTGDHFSRLPYPAAGSPQPPPSQ